VASKIFGRIFNLPAESEEKLGRVFYRTKVDKACSCLQVPDVSHEESVITSSWNLSDDQLFCDDCRLVASDISQHKSRTQTH